MPAATDYVRKIEPLAGDWRHQAWDAGAFDAGRRDLTPEVEGVIRSPRHVVMATLEGGAGRLSVRADCGHRFEGEDRAGAVSFVPADCERRLGMAQVRARWASVSLDPDLFVDGRRERVRPPIFTNRDDPFARALLAEMAALHDRDGSLEATYCEAMGLALARHLLSRHRPDLQRAEAPAKIAPWRMRRIRDHVEAGLHGPIRIADLAALADLSPGYFHRAFRATTGKSPLAYVNERRVLRAQTLLRGGGVTVAEAALAVGFTSPSWFARVHRAVTGASPAASRRAR